MEENMNDHSLLMNTIEERKDFVDCVKRKEWVGGQDKHKFIKFKKLDTGNVSVSRGPVLRVVNYERCSYIGFPTISVLNAASNRRRWGIGWLTVTKCFASNF